MWGVLLLVLPVSLIWGFVCAAIPLAFAFITKPSGVPTTMALVIAWLVGFSIAEFEIFQAFVGYGYRGECTIPQEIIQKVSRTRPCTLAEWRHQRLFPDGQFDKLTWWFRSGIAVAHSASFAVLVMLWSRRARTK